MTDRAARLHSSMRRAFTAVLLFFAVSASAAAPDRCASPRRLLGKWSGTMSCKSGKFPATIVVAEPRAESACVGAKWEGQQVGPGSMGVLNATPTAKAEVFLLAAGQMTSILNVFDLGQGRQGLQKGLRPLHRQLPDLNPRSLPGDAATLSSGPLQRRRQAEVTSAPMTVAILASACYPPSCMSQLPRVLVVDDDPPTTHIIELILEHEGVAVTTLNDSRQVLAHVDKSPGFDLVILDFTMPHLNGFEILSRIREANGANLPVIMITGSGRQLHELVKLDVAAFLNKPIDITEMIAAVKAALGSKIAASAEASWFVASGVVASGVVASGVVASELVASEIVAAPDPVQEATLDGDLKQLIADADNASELVIGNETASGILVKEHSPLVSLVDRIVTDAVRRGASDIHFEPQEHALIVRMRFDGVLQTAHRLPAQLCTKVAARLKIMANLNISEHRVPQDGRFRISNDKTGNTECRVSTLPSLYGEKLVIRLLHQDGVHLSWAAMGMNERDQRCVEAVLNTPQGIVLATGPTGSGKTTTLYTMLKTLNTEGRNIVTVEDPVEYLLPGITQVSINTDAGLTFERVLRSLLRQDPNVILVGEMRDFETAEIGMRAAVTGHLVLSTLHTNSAAATVARLINIGIKPYLIAAGVRLIIGQRLVRLLCPKCKRASPLMPAEAALLTPGECALIGVVYRPFGCGDCGGTGYAGRRPVFEVMDLNSIELRNLVLQGDEDGIFRQAVIEGMTPIRRGALQLVVSGESCPEDAFKVLFTH